MGLLDLIGGLGQSGAAPWFTRLAQDSPLGDILTKFGVKDVGRPPDSQDGLGQMGQGNLQDFLQSMMQPQGGGQDGGQQQQQPMQQPQQPQQSGAASTPLAVLIQQYLQQQRR